MCDEGHGSQSPLCTQEGSYDWIIQQHRNKRHKCQCTLMVPWLFFVIFFVFRSTHEVVEIDNYLYALGGNDGSSSLNSVEKYDPQLNKWTIVNSMATRRSSIGAAVLECFNLERGLVQTTGLVTNLWHLASIPEQPSSVNSNSTTTSSNSSTTSPPLSSSVPT